MGPLRSRCQHGIRHTRGFVGAMPVQNEGAGVRHTKKAFKLEVGLPPVKGKREARAE